MAEKLNACCAVDNVDLSTGDGQLSCKVNSLTCRTCKSQFTFLYPEKREMNGCWSYVRHAVQRCHEKLAVFREASEAVSVDRHV